MIVNKMIENYPQIRFLDQFMSGHKGYIAGGCFKNIFNGEKIKDVDVFFEKSEDFLEALSYFEKSEDYTSAYDSDNVVAFKSKCGIVVELCKRVYGKPKEMIEDFDFTIAKFAYYKEIKKEAVFDDVVEETTTWNVMCDENFFEHLFLKRLVIDDKILFPVNTFERMIRYIKYGYMPCRETKINLLTEIMNANFEDGGISKSLYDGFD